jgi:hypothetical protein
MTFFQNLKESRTLGTVSLGRHIRQGPTTAFLHEDAGENFPAVVKNCFTQSLI